VFGRFLNQIHDEKINFAKCIRTGGENSGSHKEVRRIMTKERVEVLKMSLKCPSDIADRTFKAEIH
jgi:hypothetical protein